MNDTERENGEGGDLIVEKIKTRGRWYLLIGGILGILIILMMLISFGGWVWADYEAGSMAFAAIFSNIHFYFMLFLSIFAVINNNNSQKAVLLYRLGIISAVCIVLIQFMLMFLFYEPKFRFSYLIEPSMLLYLAIQIVMIIGAYKNKPKDMKRNEEKVIIPDLVLNQTS